MWRSECALLPNRRFARTNVFTYAVRLACFIGLAVVLTGCGREHAMEGMSRSPAKKSHAPAPMAPRDVAQDEPFGRGEGEPINAEAEQQNKQEKPDKLQRKIKYTADIRLITDNFPKSEDDLSALIDANNGFVSYADISTMPGQPRFGTWKARIPVENFEAFRKGIAKIGEIESNKVNTEDVTAQFFDLENHIKNKKAQEEALRELLKKTTDKMENLLAVQRELASVRDSIERSEGQLRLLANLTDLTTVTIRIQERRKFDPEKPPEPAEKPTFGSRVAKTFGESWKNVVEFVQDVAVGIVALTPWVPFLAILGGLGVWIYRRLRRDPVLETLAKKPTASEPPKA